MPRNFPAGACVLEPSDPAAERSRASPPRRTDRGSCGLQGTISRILSYKEQQHMASGRNAVNEGGDSRGMIGSGLIARLGAWTIAGLQELSSLVWMARETASELMERVASRRAL